MLSERFVLKMRASRAGYKLARKVGVTGPWVSRLLFYNEAIQSKDAKIQRLGKLLGLKESECFADDVKGRAV